MLTAAQNFARALGSAVIFLGYGLFGFSPADCDAACKYRWMMANNTFQEEPFDSLIDCSYECRERSILSQPDKLRLYIRGVFIIGLTLCDVLIIVHAIAFPIKGLRLARLYNNQTLALGGRISGIYKGPRPLLDFSYEQIVEKQHGESKIIRSDCNVEAGIQQVKSLQAGTLSKSQTSKISASVVFTLPVKADEDASPANVSESHTDADYICDSAENVCPGSPGRKKSLTLEASFVRMRLTSINPEYA